VDNSKLDLREIGRGGMDWIDVAQDRGQRRALVNTVMNIRKRRDIENRWRRYVPPKRRLTPHLHGATSKKTAFFIVTAVKTSNLTYSSLSVRNVRALT
jgi:hypothetical protein